MNILIIGGDRRTLEIIKSLQKENRVDVVGFNSLGLDTIKFGDVNIGKYDSIIFPINGVKEDNSVNCSLNTIDLDLNDINLTNIKNECKVFSGIKTNKMDELFGDKYIKLMEFDDISVENSIPTAEGTIANIIENTDKTINGSNITVLGYGRVGKTLVYELIKLGANLNVGVNSESSYTQLISKHIGAFYTISMKDDIANSDVIINTVPALILDKENLIFVKDDVYIVDISSAPYGVDFQYANSKSIKYSVLNGIPGKVAPITAGRILAKKINMILKEAL